jgi:hypothetical protein
MNPQWPCTKVSKITCASSRSRSPRR